MEHQICAEADGSVLAFFAQPSVILWNDGGVTRRHTPDLRVVFDDGRVELHEVKPRAKLDGFHLAEVDRRANIVRTQLAGTGVGYVVIDSTSPTFRVRLRNAGEILEARHRVLTPGLSFLAREALLLQGATTIGDLGRLVPGISRADVYALCLHRRLVVELGDAPLSDRTTVRLPL